MRSSAISKKISNKNEKPEGKQSSRSPNAARIEGKTIAPAADTSAKKQEEAMKYLQGKTFEANPKRNLPPRSYRATAHHRKNEYIPYQQSLDSIPLNSLNIRTTTRLPTQPQTSPHPTAHHRRPTDPSTARHAAEPPPNGPSGAQNKAERPDTSTNTYRQVALQSMTKHRDVDPQPAVRWISGLLQLHAAVYTVLALRSGLRLGSARRQFIQHDGRRERPLGSGGIGGGGC